jgi:hypothetical protein
LLKYKLFYYSPFSPPDSLTTCSFCTDHSSLSSSSDTSTYASSYDTLLFLLFLAFSLLIFVWCFSDPSASSSDSFPLLIYSCFSLYFDPLSPTCSPSSIFLLTSRM